MLKRYKIQYKKLQTKRFNERALIFFNFLHWFKYESFQCNFFIYFFKPHLIKLKFVRKLKKQFRKQLKKRALAIYFFCKPNYLIHQKFKNSRMGKGKGSPYMWLYQAKTNKPFAILRGMHFKRVHAIIKFFKKHLTKYIFIKKV